jgi:hypothetical protein
METKWTILHGNKHGKHASTNGARRLASRAQAATHVRVVRAVPRVDHSEPLKEGPRAVRGAQCRVQVRRREQRPCATPWIKPPASRIRARACARVCVCVCVCNSCSPHFPPSSSAQSSSHMRSSSSRRARARAAAAASPPAPPARACRAAAPPPPTAHAHGAPASSATSCLMSQRWYTQQLWSSGSVNTALRTSSSSGGTRAAARESGAVHRQPVVVSGSIGRATPSEALTTRTL